MKQLNGIVYLALVIGTTNTYSDAFAPSSIKVYHDVTKLHLAKSKSVAKKKKSKSNVSSLKGFGAPTTTATTNSSGVTIDRSKSALAFYDYVAANGGQSNLKRVGLGEFPLPGTDLNIRGVVALQDIRKGEPIIEIPYEMALDFGRQVRY